MKCWIARNKDWSLMLLLKYPYCQNGTWRVEGNTNVCLLDFDEELFPEVTFENSPQQVEIKLIK